MLAHGKARADIPMPRIPKHLQVKRPVSPISGAPQNGEHNPNAVFTWDDIDEIRVES